MKRYLLVILLLVVLSFAAPVSAQTDATPEATPVVLAPSAPIVVEDGGTVIVEDSSSGVLSAVLNILGVVAVALAAGGGFAVAWNRIRGSKEAKDNTERLFEGLSPTWQTTILRILDVAQEINKSATEVLIFAREVTDKQPNVETPSAPPAPSALSQPKRED